MEKFTLNTWSPSPALLRVTVISYGLSTVGAGPAWFLSSPHPSLRGLGRDYPAGGTHSPVLVVGSGGAVGGGRVFARSWIWVTKSWLSGARFLIAP